MMYTYPHLMPMGAGWAAIVLTLLVAIVAVLLAGLRPVRGEGRSTAERTLDDRFARDEIDTEEYEQRLRTLHAAHR
ncbi:hypothetical protein [Actinoplanes regularis]|uniref:hypothetical protein n=1 Tax=Actinoplanes regularis TaxID=52697 RepID=UPI0024A19C0A|nr:hypothetical protein [Actinoplanes regularis]GLW36029.1 hypothetical protein Areg01_89640 [Actinoplanes regularis]